MAPELDTTIIVIGGSQREGQDTFRSIAAFGFVLECYRTPEEFLREDRPRRPGCVLVDAGIRAEEGIAFLDQLNRSHDPLPVVIEVGDARLADAVALLQHGAVALLETPCCADLLLSEIQSAVRLDAERRRIRNRRGEILDRLKSLSEGEWQVLQDLVAGKPNKSIARSLGVALRTVEYRRQGIFSKLGVHSAVGAAATVAEFDRLTDICTLLHAPLYRATSRACDSLSIPSRLRSDWNRTDAPHALPTRADRAETSRLFTIARDRDVAADRQ